MRILHTSDWHLGRQFHGVALEDDHDHALVQCVELEDHIALQSEWIVEAAEHVLGMEVSSAGSGGASLVRADDPLAWLRFSSASRRG